MIKKEIYIDTISAEELDIISYDTGSIFYYHKNKNILHRVDGPAVVYSDGSKHWYQDGASHRVDGPAIERYDGYKAWYLNDNEYSELEFNIYMRKIKMENL